jgi:hypothetical protein
METIDQLALILSLGVTVVFAVMLLGWSCWQLSKEAQPGEQGVKFFRASIGASLVSGSFVQALLVWLVGAFDIREYHHHFAPFVWFIGFLANAAVGVVLAFGGALVIERLMPPNTTVETDARKNDARGSP